MATNNSDHPPLGVYHLMKVASFRFQRNPYVMRNKLYFYNEMFQDLEEAENKSVFVSLYVYVCVLLISKTLTCSTHSSFS